MQLALPSFFWTFVVFSRMVSPLHRTTIILAFYKLIKPELIDLLMKIDPLMKIDR
jgi:hypothetical protein